MDGGDSSFCHDEGVSDPSANCDDPPYSTSTQGTCTEIGSTYVDSSAPDHMSDPSGALPIWDCPSLDYFNAQGEHVNYSLQNNALMKGVDSSSSISITGDAVKVVYAHFLLFGNVEGDTWTPRVTIAIGIVPSSTDPAVNGDVLNLETTVSARTIDCSQDGSLQC